MNDAKIAAQVAVEAVANDPELFNSETREAILRNGEAAGVADLYLDMIR